MRIRIEKGRAWGTVQVPPSKSMSHRLLIAAALSEDESIISGISKCDDVLATIECLKLLGADIVIKGKNAVVRGISKKNRQNRTALYCRESGSTMRFLIPIAMLFNGTTTFTAADGLMKRPMTVFETMSREKGYFFEQKENEIVVSGPMRAGIYELPGNISSQFISGLLFALPLLKEDSLINIIPPLESRSYIDLTIAALKQFGVEIQWQDEFSIRIKGSQCYKGVNTVVEGDDSAAAFMAALNVLGGEVSLTGLKQNSLQGDAVYSSYFQQLIRGNSRLSLKNCPDLAPVLFAVAAAGKGGVFEDSGRLKIKESDRAAVMAEELRKFGTELEIYKNHVIVKALKFHKPESTVYGHGDHRIVMALAILLTLTGGEISGAEAVTKSYPDFFEDLKKLNIGVKKNDIE